MKASLGFKGRSWEMEGRRERGQEFAFAVGGVLAWHAGSPGFNS